jgi:glycosyltransferase involved in cell wall biosynthesis
MPREAQKGPARVLFVGGNFERKGGVRLIQAFREIRHLGVELHLVTRDNVPSEPGMFVYNDMLPNSQALKQLYHRCDVFALPTFGDSMPLVLSEAGAAGMAIVSTNIAAIPEIVRHGDTGLLVPPGDTAALIEALKLLVMNSDQRLALGLRAMAHVARQFDAETNAYRLLDLLKVEADFGRWRRNKPRQG